MDDRYHQGSIPSVFGPPEHSLWESEGANQDQPEIQRPGRIAFSEGGYHGRHRGPTPSEQLARDRGQFDFRQKLEHEHYYQDRKETKQWADNQPYPPTGTASVAATPPSTHLQPSSSHDSCSSNEYRLPPDVYGTYDWAKTAPPSHAYDDPHGSQPSSQAWPLPSSSSRGTHQQQQQSSGAGSHGSGPWIPPPAGGETAALPEAGLRRPAKKGIANIPLQGMWGASSSSSGSSSRSPSHYSVPEHYARSSHSWHPAAGGAAVGEVRSHSSQLGGYVAPPPEAAQAAASSHHSRSYTQVDAGYVAQAPMTVGEVECHSAELVDQVPEMQPPMQAAFAHVRPDNGVDEYDELEMYPEPPQQQQLEAYVGPYTGPYDVEMESSSRYHGSRHGQGHRRHRRHHHSSRDGGGGCC